MQRLGQVIRMKPNRVHLEVLFSIQVPSGYREEHLDCLKAWLCCNRNLLCKNCNCNNKSWLVKPKVITRMQAYNIFANCCCTHCEKNKGSTANKFWPMKHRLITRLVMSSHFCEARQRQTVVDNSFFAFPAVFTACFFKFTTINRHTSPSPTSHYVPISVLMPLLQILTVSRPLSLTG